jgi:AcrR family transcriptional regulator
MMILDSRRRRSRDRPSESLARGERTRRTILAHALRIAAREGLAALTIGRLAKELEMSKSGLFARFDSKEALELATVETAREVFENAVLRPAHASGRGIERLWNLCDLWLLQIERRVFEGPYFFAGALFEYADRPGPVSKAIKTTTQEWLNALTKAVENAQTQRELNRGGSADQIAREINGRLLGAHFGYLLENHAFLRETRTALLNRLGQLAADKIPPPAFESVAAWKEYLHQTREPWA